ncbi:MAG: protein kinase, partial [Acidobacteriota bacterium]
MPKPKFPLLFRVVVALAAMGLLPLAISYYQLRANEDALTDQVQRTHIVASRAAAEQVDTYLEGLLSLARSTAAHPLLLSAPQSTATQEMLQGTLLAQPAVRVLGLFNEAGETVMMVRRTGMQEEIGEFYEATDSRSVAVVRGATQRWLRIRTALPQGAGYLALLAEAEILNDKVQAFQIGQQALLALATEAGGEVFGGARSLEEFPRTLIERASTGKLDSESKEFSDPRTGTVIGGHKGLRSVPWFVLSRQPAAVARVAQERIRAATRLAALGAVLLTGLLSGGAYLTVVRPLRRLADAQSQLVGEDVPSGGSEIDQLEASFEILQQRIRDSEELGKVFLGRYEVTSLIGSGAMGSVFQGWDPKLKRELALKTMRVNAEDIDQQKLIKSLLEEAAISARFNHPNIVTVYDVADQGSAAFIAMELVNGTNLEKYLADEGPL